MGAGAELSVSLTASSRLVALRRLFSGPVGGGGGACASPVRVSRRVPWTVHLRVADPRRGARWR